MQQYFLDRKIEIGDFMELDKEASFHITKVLRMNIGDKICLVSNEHVAFISELTSLNPCVVQAEQALAQQREMNCDVTLIMSLIKKDKWDFFLMKATELGVNRIVPYEAKRSVVKSDKEKKEKKLSRWNKIVTEAAEQSRRLLIPEIVEPIQLKEVKHYCSEVNIVAYEKESGSSKTLRNTLNQPSSITVILGPEGGFDESEIAEFEKLGFAMVSLGNRILRAETAACYVLSAIDALIE